MRLQASNVEHAYRIPDDIYEALKRWRRWCFQGYLPREFFLACQSAESHHAPERGDVHLTTAELTAQARRQGLIHSVNDAEACQIEKTLLIVPRRSALCIRVHFVGEHMRLAMNVRMRVVGFENDYTEYRRFLYDSVGALWALMGKDSGRRLGLPPREPAPAHRAG